MLHTPLWLQWATWVIINWIKVSKDGVLLQNLNKEHIVCNVKMLHFKVNI